MLRRLCDLNGKSAIEEGVHGICSRIETGKKMTDSRDAENRFDLVTLDRRFINWKRKRQTWSFRRALLVDYFELE